MRYRRFRVWLHQFNPVALWREERRMDREAHMAIAEELGSAIRSQSEVATKALELANQMIRNMHVDPSDAPTSWTVRDEDEVKAAAERMNLKVEDFEETFLSY